MQEIKMKQLLENKAVQKAFKAHQEAQEAIAKYWGLLREIWDNKAKTSRNVRS
jgi:hypothetical protein